ncbi:hypothetical protein [Lentilactobacillus farraginis]|uniref:Uncharacterized protein n=1 Tax=Lentilactobacillus farraginis DSM 18382 = JCM 14108 TaxID=1423743 RepID=X0PK70_9LACO|nr:hypothetical protein [Lentilactobacillus farraginis]GAF37016.1 hypothetical protein JCM14108_2015 [Lentilactobacillus farraginis DSM 18382 = JCM 14108]
MKPIRNQAIFLSFLAISVLVTGGHFYLDTASAKADFHISHQFDVPQVSSYSYKETSHTTYQANLDKLPIMFRDQKQFPPTTS